jgi:hypothetical protein
MDTSGSKVSALFNLLLPYKKMPFSSSLKKDVKSIKEESERERERKWRVREKVTAGDRPKLKG